MGENIFDSFGNFLGISYTSNERKRDKYQSLYSSLNGKITKASDEIDKANGRFNRCCSYGNPETPANRERFMPLQNKIWTMTTGQSRKDLSRGFLRHKAPNQPLIKNTVITNLWLMQKILINCREEMKSCGKKTYKLTMPV